MNCAEFEAVVEETRRICGELQVHEDQWVVERRRYATIIYCKGCERGSADALRQRLDAKFPDLRIEVWHTCF